MLGKKFLSEEEHQECEVYGLEEHFEKWHGKYHEDAETILELCEKAEKFGMRRKARVSRRFLPVLLLDPLCQYTNTRHESQNKAYHAELLFEPVFVLTSVLFPSQSRRYRATVSDHVGLSSPRHVPELSAIFQGSVLRWRLTFLRLDFHQRDIMNFARHTHF